MAKGRGSVPAPAAEGPGARGGSSRLAPEP